MLERINIMFDEEKVLLGFDFKLKTGIEGACCLSSITNGKYEYDVYYKNPYEDGGDYTAHLVADRPISNISELTKHLINHRYRTLNEETLTYFVKNNLQRLIDKAIQLDAEVLGGDKYKEYPYRKGEPWADVATAVDEIKRNFNKGNESR